MPCIDVSPRAHAGCSTSVFSNDRGLSLPSVQQHGKSNCWPPPATDSSHQLASWSERPGAGSAAVERMEPIRFRAQTSWKATKPGSVRLSSECFVLATLIVLRYCILAVLVRLSGPVQGVTDWNDSSPKWPVLMATLNPTHSLSQLRAVRGGNMMEQNEGRKIGVEVTKMDRVHQDTCPDPPMLV